MDIDFYKRIFLGSILLFLILIIFYTKLDYLLYFSILILMIFDFYKSNIFKSINYIKFLFIFFLFITLLFIDFNLSVFLVIFTILFSLYLKKFVNEAFILFIIIFSLIFYKIGLLERNMIFYIIFISFINDTSAYIFGKTFKGPLIIPSITPKKTWSGTLSSFIISLFILILLFDFSFFISILLSFSLFLGDLYFSFVKRFNNLKDFSNILSGHGGIFDRIDSMTIFTIILMFYQYQ